MVGLVDLDRILGGSGLPSEREVLFVADALIAALDDATAGRNDARDRQHHDVTGRCQQERRLHERFAKAPPADDQGAIVILQRSREGFGCARTVLVDEHDER